MDEKKLEHKISKENRDLITLAVKCKFINADQENIVLTSLFSGLKNQSESSIIDIFESLGILSQNEINFLISIKTHLKSKFLDITFGKLAVANHFTTPTIIKKALERQITHFRKTRDHLPIGDILVKNRQIIEADKIAILLTQDRIADEFLARAMNTLAKNELEKLAINKRFGSIAVKNNYVSIDDINQALTLQKKAKTKGIEPKYIGEILEESFNLSPEDTIRILKEQKKYEKRRLNLETALFKYNCEIKINQMLSRLFEYHVSKDKLEAHIRITLDFSDEIHIHNIINWIKLMGIRFGITDNGTIEKFLIERKKGSALKIAQGISPKKGKNASIKFYFDQDEADSNGEKNKTKRQIIRKGKVLAQKIPHKDGTPGKNVFGQTIFPPQPDVCDLRCGKGVASKDNLVFIARSDGCPALYQNRTLFVTPLSIRRKTLKISHDITCETEKSYKMMNLEITGKINKGACLECQQLKIIGDVLGNIDAAGDIEIRGRLGIPDKNRAKNEDGPVVKTQGSIYISKSVENAKVTCGRIFQAPNADITASQICAQHGIYCKNVYSNGPHPSTLEFGKRTNHRLLDIQTAINQGAKALSLLKREPQLNNLEKKFHRQIQAQDEYREKQSTLAYLIKILGNLNLENIDTLGPGFDFLEDTKQTDPDEELSYGIPKKTKAYEYLQTVLDKIDTDPLNVQLKVVQSFLEENTAMYKAAVNATERMEKECSIKSDLIKKEIKKDKSIIDKKEKELNDFILEKDYLLLHEAMQAPNKSSEIKIKNQLSKDTLILGRQAKLKIKETIYGVRIDEKSDPITHRLKIDITGYFE